MFIGRKLQFPNKNGICFIVNNIKILKKVRFFTNIFSVKFWKKRSAGRVHPKFYKNVFIRSKEVKKKIGLLGIS